MMFVKIFSIPFKTVTAGFDDSEIRSFVKDKQVTSVCHHFFVSHETPYLAFVVKYRMEPLSSLNISISNPRDSSKNPNNWQKILQESDMGLFNLFREWRAKRSKKEGIPSYVLFTNNQLAQVVIKKPQSLAELSSIEGIGKAKLEKYGLEILAISKIDPQEKLGI